MSLFSKAKRKRGSAGSLQPAHRRHARRRLLIEQLESRRLLTIDLHGTVCVTGLPSSFLADTTQNVPVQSALVVAINASTNVIIDQTTTNSKGAYEFPTLNINNGQILQVKVEGICKDADGHVLYEIQNPDKTEKYEQIQAKLATKTNNVLGNITINAGSTVPAESARGYAFAIYSVVKVYEDYAIKMLIPPPTVIINYAGKTMPFGKSTNAGRPNILQSVLTFYADDLTPFAETIGHEFGHAVAFGQKFANGKSRHGHCYGVNLRTQNAPKNYTLTEDDRQVALTEGWATYFALQAAYKQDLKYLNIKDLNWLSQGSLGGGASMADPKNYYGTGKGEDDEGSVTDILWTLAEQKNEVFSGPQEVINSLRMDTTSGASNGPQTLMEYWKQIFPGTGTPEAVKQSVSLGTVFANNGVSAQNTGFKDGAFAFTVRDLYSGNPSYIKGQGTLDHVQLLVFNGDWKQVYDDSPVINLDPGKKYKADGTLLGTLKQVVNDRTIDYQLILSPAELQTIAAQGGVHYVISACEGANIPANCMYWSASQDFSLGKPFKLRTFNGGGGTFNSFTLSYDILPPGDTWTGAGTVTIPAFTVYVYGSSDANLNDAVVEGQQVASYYVSDSQDLTGTADDYTRTLSLPASAINADLLEEVAPGGDRFLVGQVVFDGDPTGELSVPFRFQGGTFETTDSAGHSIAWVYGGASLDQDWPQTSGFTDNVTIASAGTGVTVDGTISDDDGDAPLQFAQTFLGNCTSVYVYAYDNDSTIDGSGITNANTSFYVSGRDGDDVVYGGAGSNTLLLGNGTDVISDQNGGYGTIQVGDGNDTIDLDSGPWTVTAGNGNDVFTLGSGNVYLTAGGGNDGIQGSGGNYSLHLGGGDNSVQCSDGMDSVTATDGNNVVDLANTCNSSATLGNGDNVVVLTDCLDFSLSAGGGDNDIDFSGAGVQDITLGGGSNTLCQTAPDYQSGDAPSITVDAPGGENAFFLDAGSTCAWSISANSGGNDLILTDFPASGSTTTTGSVIGLPSGGSINYTGAMNSMTCLVNGASNTLVLDNGGTVVYGLDEIPDGTNVTIANDTCLDAYGQALDLGTVTLVNGTIIDSQGGGLVNTTSCNVQNGWISANLTGGPLTMSGDGYVGLTGTNSFSSTTIGSTSADIGTLAVGTGSLGSGPITFYGPGTLQALADLTITQAIVTSTQVTIDTNGWTVTLTGGASGPNDLVKIGGGTLDLSGVDNSGLDGNLVVQGGFVAANSLDSLGNEEDSTLIFDGGGLQWTAAFDIPAGKVIEVCAGGAEFDTNGCDVTVTAAMGVVNGSDTSGAAGGITVMDSLGGGVVRFSGTNLFQGNVEIAGGMAEFETTDSLPGTAVIMIDTGGTLEAAGAYSTAAAWLNNDNAAGRTVIDTDSTGTLALTADEDGVNMTGYDSLSLGAVGNVTFDGTLTPASDTYMLGGGPGTLTLASALSGDYSVVVNGNVDLGASINCTGDLTVNGRLDACGNNLEFAGLWGSGTIQSSLATATVTVNGNGETSEFDGTLQDGSDGQLALSVANGCTVVLAGTSTFSGNTAIDSTSTLDAGAEDALSANSLLLVNGTFDLCGFPQAAGPLTGNGTIQSSVGPAALTVAGGGTAFYGTLTDCVGPLSVIVTGSGTAILGGTNLSTGGLDIEGAAQLASTTALGAGSLTVNGTLDLEGYSNSVAVAALWGSGTVQSSSALATLWVAGDGGWSNFDGTLQDGDDGRLALTVDGGNTVVLAGNNSFSGRTTVASDSTIVVGAIGGLSQYSGLVVQGSVDLDGFSCTVNWLGNDSTDTGIITNNASGTTSTLTLNQSAQGQDVTTAYYGTVVDGLGTVAIDLAGTGTVIVTGSGISTYSAGTMVSSGTLVITAAAAQPDGGLTVLAGATFIFDPSYLLPTQLPNRVSTGPGAGGELGDSGGGLDDTDGPPAIQDIAPVVTAIQCVSFDGKNPVLTGPSLVDTNSVSFEVDFNKSVSTPATSDFEVTGLPGVVSSISGSGSEYFVTVTSITGSGNVGLAIAADNSITDDAGTPLAAMTTIAVDQQYTIDRQLYWAGNAATIASSTWDTGQNWRVGSPTGPLQAWCDGSDVFFVGAPQSVSITNAVTVSSISVLTDGWVFSGAPIELSGATSQVDVAAGTTTMLCGLVGNLSKTGDGCLVLSGGISSCSSISVGAGVLDLGSGTTTVSSVVLTSGSLLGGTLNVSGTLQLYAGTVSADVTGTAALEKLGTGTVVLGGNNTYSGGTIAQAGTLIAAYSTSLPGTVTGAGTIIVQPTLCWSGQGDWTTGTWELDGTPTSWVDGASVVIAAGSDLSLSTTVNVSAITVQGDATIEGSGTIILPASGSTVNVTAGTATIEVAIAGGNPIKTGAGTADFLAPLASPPAVDGGQAIGPGAVFSGDESLAALNPAMFGLVQSLFIVDQTIDREDMIQILQSADVGGAVTTTALSALEMLTTPQNESFLAMPNYVAVLASDVVQGNAANANYQGQPLGNLAAQPDDGTRATALTDLVDKWFYGTDLPAIDPTFVSLSASYSAVAGPLYGDNPNPELQIPSSSDDEQGNLGDCYLIAALGAIADSSPGAIENMIISNGVENGIASYTVRFYYQNNGTGPYIADYVTVNGLLPAWQTGGLVYDRPGPDGSYWLPIIEKAYAQWNETGHEGRDGTNTYSGLYSGYMNLVDQQVLGTAATTYSPAASDLATKQAVITAIQNHEAVTAAIFLSGDPEVFYDMQLVSCHAYEIASYDADPNSPTYDTFQLENPWGEHEPLPLSWSQLCAYGWIAVADTSGTVAADSMTAGATAATNAATDVEAHATVFASMGKPNCAAGADVLASFASSENSSALGNTQDMQKHAVDMLMAEFGR
jgi:autotransporter-associated beta strand protein